ncbi:hypothetical protein AB0A73_24655 [Glycomyces sp. NPDC047369]
MTRIATEHHHHHPAEPVRLPSLAARATWAIIAGLGLCALLVGVPFILLAAFGWPPPFPDATAWKYPHLFTNEILASALAWAGWITWAWLLIVVLREAVHALRWGINPEHLRDAASPVRWLAGALIGAVAALWPATTQAALPAPAAATTSLELDDPESVENNPARLLVWRTDTTAETADTSTTRTISSEPETDPATGLRVVTVGPENPTLWDMAETHLGDGTRYMEIFNLNQSRDLGNGDRLTQPWVVLDGWKLLLPDTDTGPGVDEATGLRVVTVGPKHPTLWDIAGDYLGDPTRYMEIFELNKHRDFPGGPFDDPDEVQDGWQLLIPDTETDEPSTETSPPAADDEGEIVEPPKFEPDAGDTEPEAEDLSPPAASPDPGAPELEPSDETGSSFTAMVPFGVWLTAGTCLAAGTVVAIAHGLRRRRSGREPVTDSMTDEVMTGRLSDLEAIIETEARKLAEPLPDSGEPPVSAAPVVGVSTDRTPIALSDLAAEGVGLRGPGQRGAARAAILTATAAGARVLVTEAADLRLELGTEAASDQLHFTSGLEDALQTQAGDTDLVVVCADTDLDEATRPLLEQFLNAERHSAFILGDWIPSSLVLAADGTVRTAHGRSADTELRSLHIADHDTTATVLAGLAAASTDTTRKAAIDAPAPDGVTSTDEPHGVAALTDQGPAATEETGPPLRLCLFGQADLYLGDQLVQLKKGRRALRFLTVLALADEPVPLADLLAGVVGDQYDTAKAKNNLNTIGSATRGNLQTVTGTDHKFYTYDQRTETYTLEMKHFTTDLAEFDHYEQAAALATDPAQVAQSLEAAVTLYTGDLAPDVENAQINGLRTQYRAAAARACSRLADFYVQQGDSTLAAHYRDRGAGLPGALKR